MKKMFLFLITLMLVSSVFSFPSLEKFRIVKDAPYVPSPVIDKEKYIEENYFKVINSDESVSFIKVNK